VSRYDDMPDAARQLMYDFDEIDIAEMLAAANEANGELRQRVTELEAQSVAASRYAPASDVRPGWTVRVGLAEISVREVFKHDPRSLSLVYFEGHIILANDEPVIVVHRCDTKEADHA
jgi:hypothetical protein